MKFAAKKCAGQETIPTKVYSHTKNGVYKLNPTVTNVKDLKVNPSGVIKPIKATGGKVINGEFMFVVDDSGKLIIGNRARNTSFSNPPGKAPHPCLIGGPNPQVQAAGVVYFKVGEIHRVDIISGHFKDNSNSIGVAESNFKN